MIDIEETELETWFERDRAHVALRHKGSERTIVDWWDDDVWQAIEDGFLDHTAFVLGRLLRPARLHASAYDYARDVGLLEPRRRGKRRA